MKNIHKKQLLLTTLLSGVAFGAAMPAFAQTANDEVISTGTRIVRQNLESPSPVTTIDAESMAFTNTVNTETFINTLPQLVPEFDGTSNNPGSGTATADLRGLGSKRTLVLVDGNRYVSAFGDGVVDLNSIPTALVKRVDIVTGGASAVYGSDAMSRVVNFILNDEFEGVEVEGSYEMTGQGDGAKKNFGITMGGNFDNGRGNATVHLGYSQRDALYAAARDFTAITNVDGAGATGFSPGGSSSVPGTRFFDNNFNYTSLGFSGPANAMATGMGADFAVTNECSGGSALRDPDGSTRYNMDTNANPSLTGDEFCGANVTFDANGNIIPWVNGGPNTTRYNYAPVNFLQLPQERFTAAAFAKYDVTDTVTAKIRGVFTSNNVPQELAPTPIGHTVTINLDTNPFLSPVARAAFIEANGGVGGEMDVYVARRMSEVGARNSDQELTAFQLSAELEGQWSEDWTWDAHAHVSRTNGTQVQTGNVSRSAFKDAILGEAEDSDGNALICNIFGAGNFSQECADYVSRTGTIQTITEQKNLVFTSTGPVNAIQLPSAENPLQLVVGAEYREEEYASRPDSVLGPDVAGFNQSLPVAGDYNTYEVFGEAYLPLIEGASFAKELSLNGAYRYSNYSTVGGVSSYAVGAEWVPVDDIRFRGQYQRAVRAPNVIELYSAFSNGFPGAQDPCSMQGNPPVPAAATAAACATATAVGVPASVYNTAFQPNSQIESLFGGNPDLEAEKSDTFSIGFVATPAMIEGLTVAVDYYDITINDAISRVPAQTLLNDCYSGAVSAYCTEITRNSSGIIESMRFPFENLAKLTAKGVDAELNYGFDADKVGLGRLGGRFAVDVKGGYRIERGTQATATSDFYNCAGYFGATGDAACGTPKSKWKHTAALRYSKGDVMSSLNWRYIGGTVEDDQIDGGASSNRYVTEISAWSAFDWSTRWDISEHFQLTGGVVNIFDKEPPLLGDCCSEQVNTYPATYNPLGRKFFIAGKMKF